jgi:hypothetical protein
LHSEDFSKDIGPALLRDSSHILRAFGFPPQKFHPKPVVWGRLRVFKTISPFHPGILQGRFSFFGTQRKFKSSDLWQTLREGGFW